MAKAAAGRTAQADGATSLGIETYSRLRQDILDAVLAPNSRLKARELCVRYAAGLSPVREALNRLLSESLVRHSAASPSQALACPNWTKSCARGVGSTRSEYATRFVTAVTIGRNGS